LETVSDPNPTIFRAAQEDAIRVQPERNGNVKILLADIKATRQELLLKF
jgi:hypothetical protein